MSTEIRWMTIVEATEAARREEQQKVQARRYRNLVKFCADDVATAMQLNPNEDPQVELDNEFGIYSITLDDIDSPSAFLDCLRHLNTKSWFTPQFQADFIDEFFIAMDWLGPTFWEECPCENDFGQLRGLCFTSVHPITIASGKKNSVKKALLEAGFSNSQTMNKASYEREGWITETEESELIELLRLSGVTHGIISELQVTEDGLMWRRRKGETGRQCVTEFDAVATRRGAVCGS